MTSGLIDQTIEMKGAIAMSDTQRRASYTADEPYQAASRREPTAWVGFVVFGAIMLVMMGGFEAIQGLVAIFRDDYYYVTRNGLLLTIDYTAWGWIHLVIALIAVAAGLGILAGQMWARVTGIVIAVISAFRTWRSCRPTRSGASSSSPRTFW